MRHKPPTRRHVAHTLLHARSCNSVFFTFVGVTVPWSAFNDPALGLTYGNLTLLCVGVLFLRPLVATMWVYDANAPPGVSLWAPLQVSLFLVVLDYWFYIYHRSMHECKPLWFIHRLHHTTKHPNAMLGAFADNIQEWGDILLIPILTWMVVPLDFHTWYLTTCYQAYTEAAGHSGIRLYWLVPATSWLRIFDAELAMEDHDLHHRLGNGRRSFVSPLSLLALLASRPRSLALAPLCRPS